MFFVYFKMKTKDNKCLMNKKMFDWFDKKKKSYIFIHNLKYLKNIHFEFGKYIYFNHAVPNI